VTPIFGRRADGDFGADTGGEFASTLVEGALGDVAVCRPGIDGGPAARGLDRGA
jgi:hypothetical protein